MRIYVDAYELVSEIYREVWEMGVIVHPNSMQNKVVIGDESFSTKEVLNYSYCLKSLNRSEYLFGFDPRSKAWAEEEFKERVNRGGINPGIAWEIRGDVWSEFLKDGKFEYTYGERLNHDSNLDKVIGELKSNSDSRQCVIPIYNPNDPSGFGGKFRVPCSLSYQFIVRGGKLHIIYTQRSADVVTHFGNDVYLAFKLMQYVAKETGNLEGYLYHNIASLHCYKKDWDKLKTGISSL